MKISTALKSVLFALILIGISVTATAQEKKYPNEVFGLGGSIGGYGGVGAIGAYAINQDFHLGANFGFFFQTADGESQTFLNFAPFGKLYLCEPMRSLRPWGMASFGVSTRTESYKTQFQEDATRTVTSTGIQAALGGDWQPVSSVTVFAGVNVIGLDFDPTIFSIGVSSTFLGIIFWL